MPNILTEQLPGAVEIDGVEYALNTDFRCCLRVILAFEDVQLTGYEKSLVMLENLYPTPPHDLARAIELAQRFLNGGKVQQEESDASPLRLYSFEQDANLIYAAFQQTHGIDLETADLHWWKFLALFMDLGSETTFCNLVALRKRIKTGQASREERAAAREMGDLIDLPEFDTRTPEEREQEAEFMRLIALGKER